jgi:peroxiredoxin
MNMKFLTCGKFVMLLVLALLCGAGDSPSIEAPKTEAPKKKAANFDLPDLSGKKMTLQQLQKDSKLVMLVFSSSTCVFSKDAGKELNGLNARFADKGLKMAVIQVGPVDDAVKKFYADLKISQFVLADADEKIADAYQVKKVPDVLLINPDGEIVYESLYNSAVPGNIETLLKGEALKPSATPGAGKG